MRRIAGAFEQCLNSVRTLGANPALDLKDELAKALEVSPANLGAHFHNIEHHRAHLASSFFVSPFERAALLSKSSRSRTR